VWGLQRLLLSALVHGDDRHLYYNMTSLLWKGINLEGSMGTQVSIHPQTGSQSRQVV
jgi:rhomboid domain-containing protein 1